jgi:hypothetical protein
LKLLVKRYINGQHQKINGWLADFSSLLIAKLAASLEEENIRGASVEIGAHHGRLFILLHLVSTGEQDMVIDVFDAQHLNVDHSGKGDKAVFLRNLVRFGGDPARVRILQKSSLDVRPAEIVETVGHPLLFSIDGGHTAECTYNDLRLADVTLAEQGIVILDDFFNEFWPEVAVGTMSFLNESGSRLRPFAISPGKVYLCRPGQQTFFHAAITGHFSPRYIDKEAQMFGNRVLVVGVRDGRRNWHIRLAWTITESAIGRRLGMQRWLSAVFSSSTRVQR